MKAFRAIAITSLACAAVALAQPAPTTRSATRSAEETLSQMLKPSGQQAQPLKPIPGMTGMIDTTSGPNAVMPGATTRPVMREGTFIVDRAGRMTKLSDRVEFSFDSDGRNLSDPPVVLLPNLNLMKMEASAGGSGRDVRFRITGEVTEYRGRNYVLLQKVSPIADVLQPLR